MTTMRIDEMVKGLAQIENFTVTDATYVANVCTTYVKEKEPALINARQVGMILTMMGEDKAWRELTATVTTTVWWGEAPVGYKAHPPVMTAEQFTTAYNEQNNG